MFGIKKSQLSTDWRVLTDIHQLAEIAEASKHKPQLIFKHSTRCGTSVTAKSRLENHLGQLAGLMDMYYLDLLAHRDVSNEVASRFEVIHQSPQSVLVFNGECVLGQDHFDVQAAELIEMAQSLG